MLSLTILEFKDALAIKNEIQHNYCHANLKKVCKK